MHSIVKLSQILKANKKWIEKMIIKRSFRTPLVVDMSPDYYETIDIKLNKINFYENEKHFTYIGFSADSLFKKNLSSIRKSIQSLSQNREDFDDIEEDFKQNVNYSQIYEKWLLSEEGFKSIIDLANHYSIFRDLFPPLPALQPKSPVEEIPPKPVYYFSPLVPIHAEFCVNESKIETNINDENSDENVSKSESNDIIVSRVFRGNLILSENCMNAPNVRIDSSAINGINNVENYNNDENCAQESSGRITLLNDEQNYYTLGLINLDSHFGNESNVCHWLLTNIHNKNKVTNYETVVKYLPIYGIKGLGYHRYVFILYQHNRPLSLQNVNDFDLKKRKFDAFRFMSSHGSDCQLTPIGLSWFQTTWDYNSQKIFYDYLDMRSPTYEWIFPVEALGPQKQFPHKQPFNLYLDHYRDPKEIAKSVLLERLSTINPYNYKNMFDVNPLPHIERIPENTPDWIRGDIKRRRERRGVFRGLRPHSAIIPLNNNADLDHPKWPRIHPNVHPLNLPIRYPDGKRRPIPLKQTFWVKPPHEHPTYRITQEELLDESDKKHLKKSE